MKKQKENLFAEKFRLLSSQGSTEEINWSSSDSGEFENLSSNAEKVCSLLNRNSRKRKRKQKVPKNLSNLEITIIDSSKDNKHILHKNHEDSQTLLEANNTSPILGKPLYFPPYKCQSQQTSPIISSAATVLQSRAEKSLKSPIIVLKNMSPKTSPKVRKKLFSLNSNNSLNELQNESKSANDCMVAEKSSLVFSKRLKSIVEESISNSVIKDSQVEKLHKDNNINKLILPTETQNVNQECTIQETPENLDNSFAILKTSSAELAKKVKSYFDNHFSSESISQVTISESETPKNSSKTSDDVEISDTITQVASNRNSLESIKEEIDDMNINKKDKKLRYKKDGLAYRLNNLLKKRVASISLWQHERFMAANSNFVIPKGEYVAFRICDSQFKYGNYLLQATDVNDDKFMIVINKCYVTKDSILRESVFKLYEPYKYLDCGSDCKIIINVCKFETVSVNT